LGTFSFTKEERIRKHREFLELKQKGAVFKTRKLLFNYRKTDGLKRLGVIVTKKVGNAVYRGKVKRWLREVFRTNRNALNSNLDIIIIPRTSNLSYHQIESDFQYFTKWHNEKHIDMDS
jgi:ribonuclease P protein component